MLANYIKITFRNLWRQRGYAVINIFSLAVGLAFCALIFLYVRDELTYDRFHEHADRIYRVTTQDFEPDGSLASDMAWQPMPLAPTLQAELPEIEEAVRCFDLYAFVRLDEQAFEERILFADPSVFEVFSFPLQQGDPTTALADLNRIVLSESAARKYFGDADPVGRTLEVRLGDAYQNVVVSGVAASVPGNSSIRFDFLMPFDKLPEAYAWIQNRIDRWNASSFFVYVLLNEQAMASDVQAKLRAFRASYYPDEAAEVQTEGQGSGDQVPSAYRLQPLTSVHLDPTVAGGLSAASDPRYSYILAGIAWGILLIACINFTTLAVARSAGRGREIGVRKVVGAHRRQVMVQFWGEALLLSLLALGIGMALAELFLPTFNTLAAKDLQFDYLNNGSTILALVGLVVLVGLLAGGYPALVLSGFKPIDTLKQNLRVGGSSTLTRSLVVVQFVLSAFLVVSTLVMLRQLDHLQSQKLGFNQEHVVVIPTNDQPGTVLLNRFRTALDTRPDVFGVTAMSSAFAQGWSREGWTYREEYKTAYVYRVEPNFLDVMQMDLIDGRNFDARLATDSTDAVLVNEAFVRDFGWTEPLNQTLDGFYAEPTVVGVVRDFNFQSLHQGIEPMVLTIDPDWGIGHLLVRIAPTDLSTTLDVLRTTWDEAAPGVPFQYSFLDEDLARQYVSEQRWSRIVGYGAGFAILIACLGLIGLAALSVAGRTKEIGIRKVLGASVAGVTTLLSREFVRVVLVALVIATPLAYFVMKRWLDGFAYRIEPGPGVFVLTGIVILALALLTVIIQALRAALANPVDALRYE